MAASAFGLNRCRLPGRKAVQRERYCKKQQLAARNRILHRLFAHVAGSDALRAYRSCQSRPRTLARLQKRHDQVCMEHQQLWEVIAMTTLQWHRMTERERDAAVAETLFSFRWTPGPGGRYADWILGGL